MPASWPLTTAPGFPGLIAPASLKLDLVGCIRSPVVGFPGLIAPASLKQRRTVTRPDLSGAGFPGLIAPASLKLCVYQLLEAVPRRFSGVNRPGLIEASSFGSSRTRICRVFRG